MATFMEIRSMNPRLRQDQLAKELGCSSSTSQRYRQNKKMRSTYRIPPNSNKTKQNISSIEHGLERPKMTSKDFK